MRGLESWIIAKSLERMEAVSNTNQVLNGIPLDELDLVNSAVVEAVPGAKGLRYDIKYRRLVLDWVNAEPTPFDTLSDGQRGMVALVADIARRMCLLKTVFPKVQFIAASHSPQIIGELSASEVWLMRDSQVLGNPERALGLSSGEVLKELMEGKARNVEVTSRIDAIRALLDNDDIVKAQSELDSLREEVGDIPLVLELQATIQSLQ